MIRPISGLQSSLTVSSSAAGQRLA